MSELRTAEVDDLLEVLVGVHDTDTAFALLEDLFTIREIKETSQRLAVARMLSAGKPYVAIEDATGASATTIARVSKALNYGSGAIGLRSRCSTAFRTSTRRMRRRPPRARPLLQRVLLRPRVPRNRRPASRSSE